MLEFSITFITASLSPYTHTNIKCRLFVNNKRSVAGVMNMGNIALRTRIEPTSGPGHSTNVVGMNKMGNISPRSGIDPIPLACHASVPYWAPDQCRGGEISQLVKVLG